MTQTNLTELAVLDRAHALHPWTHFDSFEAEGALVIARGKGSHLWDDKGNDYLDAVGGLWCTQIGLGRQEMADAIGKAALDLAYSSTFVDMTNGPSARLAARLAALAPEGLNRVMFTTGGSTAVETAFRMAQFYQASKGFTGRTQVIARRASYHGSTYLTASIGLRDGDRVPELGYIEGGIHHLSAPNLYRRPEGLSEAAFSDRLVAEFEARIAEIGPEKIAAFFAEPIQASGGVLVPPKGYLRRMAEVCRRHGILYVADEVVTGFGRLGEWFASEAIFEAKPDIITSAKGLSSGYQPIGAAIFSDDIWEAMRGDHWFTHGFTYAGHPVACAAALKNIEIIENEGLLEHASKMGALFQEGLASLSALPIVGDARGMVLVGCIENVADKATKRLFADEVNIGKRVSDTAEAMGLLVRPMAHLNVMSPPLVITEVEVQEIIDKLGRAITEVTDGLVRDRIKVG